MSEYSIISFASSKELENWLHMHHALDSGVWIKFAKKGSGISSVTYQEALLVALCYGWIDGQRKSLDDNYFLQKFTPRTKTSMWSKRNIGLVEHLLVEKKMQPAGLAEIERAKADGRWERAYNSPKHLQVPEDFLEELKKDSKTYEFFLTLNKTNIYAIAFRLATAKKLETRLTRMRTLMEMLRKREKLY